MIFFHGEKSLRLRNILTGYFLILPAMVLIGFLAIYPVVFLLKLSFSKLFFEGGLVRFQFIGFGNFADVFYNSMFWTSLKHSLYLTGVSVTISFIIAIAISLALNRMVVGTSIFRPVIFLPYIMAPVVTSLIWKWLYNDIYGLINVTLRRLGLAGLTHQWLGEYGTALNCVVVVDLWRELPFMILILSAGLGTIPEQLYEAGRIDGTNKFQAFWHITLPLLKFPILVVLLMRTMFTLRIFDLVFVLTGGGPGDATEVLATHIYDTGIRFLKFGYSSTVSLIILGITFLIALFMSKLWFEE